MKKPRVLIALTALTAGTVSAQSPKLPVVEFSDVAVDQAQLLHDRATVYDGAGQPIFTGTQAFIREVAENADGRLFAYDQMAMRVRVTPYGESPMWLSCRDLQPMKLACATHFGLAQDGVLDLTPVPKDWAPVLPTVTHATGPDCPGDLRCPKPKKPNK